MSKKILQIHELPELSAEHFLPERTNLLVHKNSSNELNKGTYRSTFADLIDHQNILLPGSTNWEWNFLDKPVEVIPYTKGLLGLGGDIQGFNNALDVPVWSNDNRWGNTWSNRFDNVNFSEVSNGLIPKSAKNFLMVAFVRNCDLYLGGPKGRLLIHSPEDKHAGVARSGLYRMPDGSLRSLGPQPFQRGWSSKAIEKLFIVNNVKYPTYNQQYPEFTNSDYLSPSGEELNLNNHSFTVRFKVGASLSKSFVNVIHSRSRRSSTEIPYQPLQTFQANTDQYDRSFFGGMRELGGAALDVVMAPVQFLGDITGINSGNFTDVAGNFNSAVTNLGVNAQNFVTAGGGVLGDIAGITGGLLSPNIGIKADNIITNFTTNAAEIFTVADYFGNSVEFVSQGEVGNAFNSLGQGVQAALSAPINSVVGFSSDTLELFKGFGITEIARDWDISFEGFFRTADVNSIDQDSRYLFSEGKNILKDLGSLASLPFKALLGTFSLISSGFDMLGDGAKTFLNTMSGLPILGEVLDMVGLKDIFSEEDAQLSHGERIVQAANLMLYQHEYLLDQLMHGTGEQYTVPVPINSVNYHVASWEIFYVKIIAYN